jgi:hypothetical protein
MSGTKTVNDDAINLILHNTRTPLIQIILILRTMDWRKKMSREAMQMALEALVTCCAEEWRTLNNFGMKQVYDEKKVNAAIAALHAALAEPDSDYERGFVDGMNLQTKGSVDKAVNRMAQNPFGDDAERYARKLHEEREAYKALFTAPTPRKPLTDEEIESLAVKHAPPIDPAFAKDDDFIEFARAVERAHGIGGEA